MRNPLICRSARSFWVFAWLGCIALGCGGRSATADPYAGDWGDDDPNLAGTGGTSASAGGQSRAGSGGRRATTGGSTGVGGKNSTSGGSSGRTGVGGTAAGGRAAGGNPGGGAGGAMVIPDLLYRCDELCSNIQAANCPGAETLPQCALSCRLLVQQPSCAGSANKLLDCTESKTISCDPNGQPTADGCEAAFLETAACLLTELDDPTLDGPCRDYCERAESAGCGTSSDCRRGCKRGGWVPTCTDRWKNYLTCSEGQTFVCSADGSPLAQSCAPQFVTFLGCALLAVGQ